MLLPLEPRSRMIVPQTTKKINELLRGMPTFPFSQVLFFFFVIFLIACSSPEKNALRPSLHTPERNWNQMVLKAEVHQKRRDTYFFAYRDTKNFIQLNNAINESERVLQILYELQTRYPRTSTFAYQTLLKRQENCKMHDRLLQEARENLIPVNSPNSGYCRFTFQ